MEETQEVGVIAGNHYVLMGIIFILYQFTNISFIFGFLIGGYIVSIYPFSPAFARLGNYIFVPFSDYYNQALTFINKNVSTAQLSQQSSEKVT